MTDELERICKETIVAYLRYYPRICLEGLRKLKKNLGQDMRCLGRDLKQARAKYESRALLPGQLSRLMFCYVMSQLFVR
jgi:hypothetical protein